jgi:hypothetical protein
MGISNITILAQMIKLLPSENFKKMEKNAMKCADQKFN